MTARPTRRTLLGAALAAPLAACTSSREGDPEPSSSTTPQVDPDTVLREQALARERSLIRTYDAALRADPERAARLAPLRAEHAAHLAALQQPAAELTPAAALPRPAAARATTARLVTAERRASAAHALAARRASPALAQVLASLAASEASHEVALS